MKDYGAVPFELEMVNLGSTFSKYGFDYKYFGKKGFNFAVAPQPLKVDFEVLETYQNHIKEGAIVVIVVVCPFGFSLYEYDTVSYSYAKNIGNLVKKAVKKIIRYDRWQNKKQLHMSSEAKTRINAKNRLDAWMNEFSLNNTMTQKPTPELIEVFKKTTNELTNIIKLCHKKKFRPIIINMPAVKEEYASFSNEFIHDFYEENMKRANIEGVPTIDYFRDPRFQDCLLYENYADCFNDKGRRFFAEIFIEDLKKLGLWQPQSETVAAVGTKSKGDFVESANIYSFEGIQSRGQYSELLQELETNSVCFGTNITLPYLFGNGRKEFLKTLLLYLAHFVRRETKNDWGKSVTIKATKSLMACIEEAVNNGIHMFDCSRAYGGSEQRLSKALSNVQRDNVFVITKINDESQFKGTVEQCFEESLRQLNTAYVDLLLLHWPVDFPKTGDERFDRGVPIYARSWRVLERIYKSGRAKAIGVANFSIAQLERLKTYAEIMPMANEFECHPLCIRKELNAYCIQNGIKVFAYASLCAMDKRLINETMEEIAKSHNRSIAQIILKWHMQRGRIPIFGTSKVTRIKEYAELSGFSLSEAELSAIDSQNINYRAFPDSERCDFTKGIWLGWENYKDYCP